jgi:hypothetical protein
MLGRPETISPSPARRSGKAGARKAISEQFVATGADVSVLVKALSDTNARIRYRAVVALEKAWNGRGIQLLCKAMGDPKKLVRRRAIEAFAKNKELAVAPLSEALKNKNELVRAGAAEALGMIRCKRAVAPLFEALRDTDCGVRGAAAVALGMIGDERALEPLLNACSDPQEEVRNSATRGLELLAVRLCDELGTTDARETLVKIGKPAFWPLCWRLTRYDWTACKRAADALGEIGDERAVRPLVKLLEPQPSLFGTWMELPLHNSSDVQKTIIDVVTKFLETSPSCFSDLELCTIKLLPRELYWIEMTGDGSTQRDVHTANCSTWAIKELADSELRRRRDLKNEKLASQESGSALHPKQREMGAKRTIPSVVGESKVAGWIRKLFLHK